MDFSESSQKEKNIRAKKMMLWFGIVSLIMGFAGWTSAYIVSSAREDWVTELPLPISFFWSTLVLLCSSLTYFGAIRAFQSGKSQNCTLLLFATLLLGIVFIGLQFSGFSQLVNQGYYFTGPTSSIKTSYVFLIAAVHIAHLVAGLISLSVVLVQQLKKRYSPGNMLGMELGATFWHFLDFLWLYLILFMYFVK